MNRIYFNLIEYDNLALYDYKLNIFTELDKNYSSKIFLKSFFKTYLNLKLRDLVDS